jgi:carbonic anhydrase/acetyltransferase-like protein (isoleucine patch superfamily)
MKYELTSETKKLYGRTLYRIKALKDFAKIKKGDLGGWVEKESNLSQNDECWLFGNAVVYGNAKVYGNACVFDNAKVYGNAVVFGNAVVYGNAQIYDNAKVFDSAEIYDNAKVFGNACVFYYTEIYGNVVVSDNAVATKEVKNIIGLPYNITITDKHIQIACKQFTFKEIIKLDKNWDRLKERYDTDEIKKIEPYRKVIVELVKLEIKNKNGE